jgi:hypothetical protein
MVEQLKRPSSLRLKRPEELAARATHDFVVAQVTPALSATERTGVGEIRGRVGALAGSHWFSPVECRYRPNLGFLVEYLTVIDLDQINGFKHSPHS